MSSDTPSLPLGLALRLIQATLFQLRRELERHAEGNPRKAAGRRSKAGIVSDRLDRLGEIMRTAPKGREFPADLTALFCAWCLEHADARSQVADLLAEEGRGGVAARVRTARDPVEALRDVLN